MKEENQSLLPWPCRRWQEWTYVLVLLTGSCIPKSVYSQASGAAHPGGLLTAPLGEKAILSLYNDAPPKDKLQTKIGQPTDEQYRDVLSRHLKTRSKWSFAFGVGMIGDTSAPEDYLNFDFDTIGGAGRGLTYNFMVAYRLHEFDWKPDKARLQPQLELPMMLTLVDQQEPDLVPDYNAGLMFRWRDWPWNRYVYTTSAIGVGISYTSKVWTADRQRHPGEDRSHLKFWMPIEVTLALPRSPEHQLTLFIDHQSGGTIMDNGGVDSWGFGYRYLFGKQDK